MKIFDAIRFLKDYSIPYSTEDKNVHAGWVGISCPFCDDPSYHGGFNLIKGYYNCWRCGHHFLDQVVSILTADRNPKAIVREYSTDSAIASVIDQKIITHATELVLPFTTELTARHRAYLISRNFDPDKLIEQWSLVATGPTGDYKFRIIAPIYLDDKLVSFQGRDITDKSELRYKACNKKDEVYHHKYTLYGIDFIKNGRAIIVEGITDCWRLGPGAIATFGTGYTSEQVLMAARRLKQVFILYDAAAIDKAFELATELTTLNAEIETEVIEMEKGDPAEMSDEQAAELKKELLN